MKRSAGWRPPERNAPLHSPIAESELVDALLAQGKSGEARARVRHAVTLGAETLGPANPAFGLVLISYAGVLKETSDLRRAEETCSRATAIFENAGDAWQVALGTGYQCLAVVQAQRRRPKAALESIRRALALWNSRLPADHPFIVYALNTQMVVHKDLKYFRAAEDMIPILLERCLSRFGPSHPERVTVLNNAAAVYSSDGKYEEAERLLRDGLARRQEVFSSGPPNSYCGAQELFRSAPPSSPQRGGSALPAGEQCHPGLSSGENGPLK